MKRSRFVSILKFAGAILVFAILTYAYLSPGSALLFEGRTDRVLSDGTDLTGLPYAYDQIFHQWKTHPSHLFYGAIYIDGVNPESGLAYWTAWVERIFVVAAVPFIPLEQISTAEVFFLFVFTATCFYLLAWYLRWPWFVGVGLSIAWAFTPFMRARGKVHASMTATYHIPLLFLALFLSVRGRTWKSVAAAAVCILVACTTIHYFIVTALFLSPFYLLFVALQRESAGKLKTVYMRLVVAVLPSLLFLGFNFLNPVPPDARMTAASAVPASGETSDHSLHPFLKRFAARPIDYLTGDLGLGPGGSPIVKDINPLKELLGDSIVQNLADGIPHERTNGIRWLIFFFAFLGIATAKGKKDFKQIAFFAAFGLFSFWLSLSPSALPDGLAPSAWLFRLVSQIRVPSRAGLGVLFSLIMITGYWLNEKNGLNKFKRYLLLPGVLPLLMIAEYPPFVQAMPISDVHPAYLELSRENGACGVGMFFPFVYGEDGSYDMMQRLRGSDCAVMNSVVLPARVDFLWKHFPPSTAFISSLSRDPFIASNLEKIARCSPLNWIAFHPAVPQTWAQSVCNDLGWRYFPDALCIAPDRAKPLQHYPEECL